jgi:SAM-dependent methyltransferase
VLDKPYVRRALRRPRWGNMRRFEPFSTRYGFDRGTPIDRYYLDRFFERNERDIQGRVLEVAEPAYASRFGSPTSIDVLDIDPRNDRATVLADLDDVESLPASRYSCAIVTQTLQFVRDPRVAVENLRRSLVPGGVLLASVPAIAKIDHNLTGVDRWRFMPVAFSELIRDVFDTDEFAVEVYGNLLSAVAYLNGIAARELRSTELDVTDPLFPVIVCGRAVRSR